MDKNTSPSPTSHFLKEVTEQISYKPLRPSIRQELESHIQDRMEDYESQGLSPKEAEAQALRCMGDAAAIGTRLNEVHKLQKAPLLTAATALLLLTGLAFAIFMQWRPVQIGNRFIYYIMGVALLILVALHGYPLLIRYRKILVLSVCPLYLSEVINTAIPNGDKVQVVSIGGTMLLFVLLGGVCSVGTGFFASLASVGFGKIVRSKIFRKVQFYSQTEFDGFSTSSLITRTNNDVVQVQTFMNMLLKVCLMAPIMCIGGVVLALAKSATMSMILIISLPVMIAFVLIIARLASPLSRKMQEKLDEINLVTREKLTGIRVARAFGTEQFEEQRFHRVNDEFMLNTIRMNSIMGIMIPGLSLILYATMVALIAFGGYQIINIHTAIPIGDIIAVIQYVMQIMMSVMMLSMIFVMYPRAAVSAGRINEVLETLPAVSGRDDGVTETDRRGYVSFRDVTFTFPHAEAPAIEHISFDSAPGEVTAIIGSTGSGKSTLVNLIPRFYDVQQGEVLVDGVNVKDMELRTLRGKIGLVPQKAFLFKGTIAENVGYGLEHPDQRDVEHAVSIAQSYDFVTAKEGGFEAPISQGGSNVSGGQRQRLAIARAIARKPEIYLFDASFSALDYKTDAALRAALLTEAGDATVILVAQRVSTIKNADRILVLEDGRCVGQGRHEELMKSCEVYREIVYSQLTQEEAGKNETKQP